VLLPVEFQLLRGFDAFCDRHQTQPAGKRADSAHDRGTFHVLYHVAGK